MCDASPGIVIEYRDSADDIILVLWRGSPAMHPDDKVLSYGNVLIRRSDVELLTGLFWLNDQVGCQSQSDSPPRRDNHDHALLKTPPSCA